MPIQDKKKIVIIFPHLESGEFSDEEYRFERDNREIFIVERTREAGYQCELVRLTSGDKLRRRDDEVGTLLFPVDNPAETKSSGYLSTALLTWVENEKPDLIVFKGLGYKLNCWLVTRSAHRFRFAFIVGGGTRDPLLSHASFCLSETDTQLQKSFRLLNKRGIAAVLPKLNPPYSGICATEKEFDIINVGRFIPIKSQKSLLPLARHYRIELVGDGPLYEEVREEVDLHGLKVSMPGNLPRPAVQKRIARSRLMVHPATSEGFPRVFMEAFACGVPVVAVRDVVSGSFLHGVHGLLVDREELVTATQELLENEDKLNELSRNAKEYADANSTQEAVWRVIYKMYISVLDDSYFPTESGLGYLTLRISMLNYVALDTMRKSAGRLKRLGKKVKSQLTAYFLY